MKWLLLAILGIPIGFLGAGVAIFLLTGDAESAAMIAVVGFVLGFVFVAPAVLVLLRLGWTSPVAAMGAGGLFALVMYAAIFAGPYFDLSHPAVGFVVTWGLIARGDVVELLQLFVVPGAIGGLAIWAWLRLTGVIPTKG